GSSWEWNVGCAAVAPPAASSTAASSNPSGPQVRRSCAPTPFTWRSTRPGTAVPPAAAGARPTRATVPSEASTSTSPGTTTPPTSAAATPRRTSAVGAAGHRRRWVHRDGAAALLGGAVHGVDQHVGPQRVVHVRRQASGGPFPHRGEELLLRADQRHLAL